MSQVHLTYQMWSRTEEKSQIGLKGVTYFARLMHDTRLGTEGNNLQRFSIQIKYALFAQLTTFAFSH